ncbi:uncharacterized protein LOC119006744 [Acanthopagrus latus]|uniref:uncharacterized protein LOC119006744 n=1 Tax=Acanthopagrus latus TaxID=8177 RepID=UPI00187C6CBA|nr:uncharacterized protein LOC119006744 [Acanthopagrus latus]
MISRVMDGLLRVYSSPPSVTLQNCDQQRAPRARSMLHVSRGEEQEQHPAESSNPWGKVTKEKMICRILLLISLNCVCGTFVVNVTQMSYQAEENHSISLEWTFTTTADTSPNSIFIFCEMSTAHRASVLFELCGGLEVPESRDQQFVGRVQWDKDVLRDGRLRLHVSRLRTEDSGRYLCDVRTNYGVDFGECQLNVSAARDGPKPERDNTDTPGRDNTARRGRVVLYCGLGLAAAAAIVFLYLLFVHRLCDEEGFCLRLQLGLKKCYRSVS